MQDFKKLTEFVNFAAKNRKYPESTAQGLRAALKLFDQELSDEERNSLQLFKERFDQIERGGPRPFEPTSTETTTIEQKQVETVSKDVQRVEWPLRPGAKVVLLLPNDVTDADIKKIKTLLDLVEVA
ncbi:hypothetical protein KW798_01245 [Candidatus Parcubacteria bacterium]|nr:hypothetical protein [Candidatus Parcubacteria bacterium]